MRKLLAIALVVLAGWGIYTVINGIRLGARDADDVTYFGALVVIWVSSVVLGWLAVRLWRTDSGGSSS